jgi:ferritin-like metal-binding protein YciE
MLISSSSIRFAFDRARTKAQSNLADQKNSRTPPVRKAHGRRTIDRFGPQQLNEEETLKGEILMPIKNRKEVFLMLLSDVREQSERTTKFFEELVPMVKDAEVKDALEARVFVSNKISETLDECFRVISEKPVKLSGRLFDTFVEDFRKELNEIQTPEAKLLFILAKINHLMHIRIGEFVALIAAADVTGHHGVALLLESCLADKHVFVERTRRLIRERIKARGATA